MGHGHDSSASSSHAPGHAGHATAADDHGHAAGAHDDHHDGHGGSSRFGILAFLVAFIAYGLGWATRPAQVVDKSYPENAGPGYFEPLPALGPRSAPVIITEVIEFKCGFCEKHNGYMKRLIAEHGRDVRFVIKHMPPIGGEGQSELASIASMAANRQSRYWDYADMLLRNQNQAWTEDVLIGYAKQLGLDVGKFKTDLGDPSLRSYVRKDAAAGRELDVRGTPSFYINGKPLPDTALMRQDPVIVRDMVRAARARVEARVAAGQDVIAARAADCAENNPGRETFARRYILNDVSDLQVDTRGH